MNVARTWYANGYWRGKRLFARTFHAEGPDWIRTGKAVCGRDISKPAAARDRERADDRPHQCKACRRILENT